MSNEISNTRMSRREFLSLTNKASVALIAAGGALSVIQPQQIFAARKSSGDTISTGMKPIQNKAIVTTQSRKNQAVVSSTLSFEDRKYLLNSEGSFIWNLCNGRHNLDMVAQALSLKYQKAPSTVEGDVYHFIDALKSSNFIEFIQ